MQYHCCMEEIPNQITLTEPFRVCVFLSLWNQVTRCPMIVITAPMEAPVDLSEETKQENRRSGYETLHFFTRRYKPDSLSLSSPFLPQFLTHTPASPLGPWSSLLCRIKHTTAKLSHCQTQLAAHIATSSPLQNQKRKKTLQTMHFLSFTTPLLLLLGITTTTVYAACREGCGNPRTCLNNGGSVSTGFCSGGSDNRYCSCSVSFCGSLGTGHCQYTSQPCSGVYQTGFCPGPSNYKCCN